MSDDLSSKERAVLLTLLVHGPALSNSEMKEFAGLALDGPDRRHLNEVQYVESVKTGRAFQHTLTPAGRKWCLDDLVAGSARTEDRPLERALYAVLNIIGGKADVQSLLGSTQFGPPSEREVETAVRAAYKKLRRERGGWVSLADLRDALDTVPPDVLDAALKRLNRQPGVVLVPESDQTVLTKRQRGAALKLGGHLKHLLSIEGT